jgi:DNA-directed RNA polymerase alpha subunit
LIRAIHARCILEALARTAEAGPVWDVVNRCVSQMLEIEKADAIEFNRGRLVQDLEISVRLGAALRVREILTVRELESKTAKELMGSSGSPGSSRYFGKKLLREAREVLALLGMKLKEDPS